MVKCKSLWESVINVNAVARSPGEEFEAEDSAELRTLVAHKYLSADLPKKKGQAKLVEEVADGA